MEPLVGARSARPEIVKKIIVLGGKAVGKTSFLRRLLGKPLAGLEYVPTVGIDVVVHPYTAGPGAAAAASLQRDAAPVHLHFWDASHTELHASPSHHALLFGQVAGVFLVLDVSSRESLEAVDAWQRLLARYVPGRVPRVLLAHKADLFSSRPAQCVVNDRLLEAYKRDAGLTDWCYTVGHEYFGDYVAARSAKSRPVADAVQLLVEHIFQPSSKPPAPGAPTDGRPSLLSAALRAPHLSSAGPVDEDDGALASSLARLQLLLLQRQGAGRRLGGERGEAQAEEEEWAMGLVEAAAAGAPLPAPGPDAAPSATHAMRYVGRWGPQTLQQRRQQQEGGEEGQSGRRRGRRRPRPVAAAVAVEEEEGAQPVAVAYTYQPLQGWLSSVDLEVLLDRSPGAPQGGVAAGGGRRRGRSSALPPPQQQQLLQRPLGEEEDAGWRHLAGSMGRTEAERLLRARPVGAFLLRRFDERALRLSYRTQYGVEHAPIVFTPGVGWGHVRHNPPAPNPGGPVPESPGRLPQPPLGAPPPPSSSQQQQQQPAPAATKPPQTFRTLAELLQFFSRKASHGLVFRRRAGTLDYEVVGEGEQQQQQQQQAGGGGVLGWLHRKVQASAPHAHQGGGQGAHSLPPSQQQQPQLQAPPPPRPPPTREEVVGLYRDLKGLLLAAGAHDEAREEAQRRDPLVAAAGRRGMPKVAALVRAREATKRRERALLELCLRSCGEAVAAVEWLAEGNQQQPPGPGKGGGRGAGGRGASPLPFLLGGAHDAVPAGAEPDPADAAALLERLEAVDTWLVEVVSAFNAALAARDPRASSSSVGPGDPLVLALRAVAGWRPYLETLRLRIEAGAGPCGSIVGAGGIDRSLYALKVKQK